jgi:raffinose/stachyose/melibiose transport system substrate-binding protein
MKMKKFKKLGFAVSVISSVILLLSACGQSSSKQTSQSGNEIAGEITVITNDPGSVETKFKDYEKAFIAKYPKVTHVHFEGVNDYDNSMKTRMNTDKYGDVLLNPNLSANQYKDFYEPLGKTDELMKKYVFAERYSYDGQVYTLPYSGDISGIVYNKNVFAKAGIQSWPKTIEEFESDLKLVKQKTDAIPYYTNYHDGWPLSQWKGNEAVIANQNNYRNQILSHDSSPFAAGKPNYILYNILYTLTKDGLIEKDPLTTSYDQSNQMIADGKIATMALGSWALDSIIPKAKNPDDVGFMPFPYQQGGKFKAMLNAGYGLAVNVHSKNKATAKAFVEFFINDSHYGSIPGYVGGKLPDSLKDLTTNNVELMTESPEAKGEEGVLDTMLTESEVGLYTEKFGRRIIDTALGRSQEGFKTYDDIVKQMNKDWAEAQKKVFQDRGIK